MGSLLHVCDNAFNILSHLIYKTQKSFMKHRKMCGPNTIKNGKTQRGGMKPLLTMDLNKTYDDNAIRALFRDDKDVSPFFKKTEKIIQMPEGLEAKLYDNEQLCFNSKKVVQYPAWMTTTFQINEIIPPPSPPDCMSTILSMIQTNNNDYEMSKGRHDLLCMRKRFSKSSKPADLKLDIDQFVVEFIKAYKYFIEITTPVIHDMHEKQRIRKEESSLSFLDDFDAVIHSLPPFISERRKSKLVQLKTNAMRSEHTDEFETNMDYLVRELIELNYIMKNCDRHNQAAFDACKLVAKDTGIVAKILPSASVLIVSVKNQYDTLKQLSQLPKQLSQPPKQLSQLSQSDWMDLLLPQSSSPSSPPSRNQFDDLLPAGGRRKRKQSRRKLMQSRRKLMQSKRMQSSS